MLLRMKYQRILLTLVLGTVIASLIVTMFSINYMQKRFYAYDEVIFNRLANAATHENLSDLFEHIHEHIIDRDIVIAVNSSGEVVESEGLVVGDEFEIAVNRKVSIEGYRITLDSGEFDFRTFIIDLDVGFEDVFNVPLENGIRLYYIPNRFVWEYDYLMNLFPAMSVACFTSAFAMLIINKDIKDVIEMEKQSL